MAKSSKSSRTRTDAAGGGGIAMVEDKGQQSRTAGKHAMSEVDGSHAPKARHSGGRGKRSFFEIYKPGQGRYTRMGTAVGGGILIVGAGNFLYSSLEVYRSDELWTRLVQLLVPLVAVVGLGLMLYWVVAVKRGACDFFIQTEGEMKKVSWSTRNELIGSTKVVIWCTLLLGFLLFLVDAMFIKFFQFINVLWSAPK